MSRRPPNPNAERTAQNTATIKSLLKLEGNKTCADCKRNKHPRWASWNLGIFVCIRCSGIHRGMGTHISRVKSVDLDSWTDEQLQSVLRWGNARANKYWESKLAPGHVPSEAKIENFIRTKYESKRWVMEGPIPDPSTLDAEGDDDVPLSLVKEKHNLDRSSQQSTPQSSGPSQIRRAQQPDLFAGDPIPRTSSTGPSANRVPPKAEPAPPKHTKPADSLLGLDFFGAPDSAQSRPASTVSAPGGPSRPDLKQSILSLYSTAPKPQPTQQSQQAFGGFVSPQSPPSNQISHAQSASQSSFGGMQDAFASLNFSPPVQSQNSTASAFAGLGKISSSKSTPSVSSPPSTNYGGNFFDSKPTNKSSPASAVQTSSAFGSSSGFGAFSSGSSQMPQTQASSGLEDLFDFGSTSTSTIPVPPKHTFASPPAQNASVFNLSQPKPQPTPQPPVASTIGWGNNTDAWGSNDAWSTPDPNPQPISPTLNKPLPPMQTQADSTDFGWGSSSGNALADQSIVPGGGGRFNQVSSPPKVSSDEDFGGWSSAAPVTPAATTLPAKAGGGFTASEDLFSNVWE